MFAFPLTLRLSVAVLLLLFLLLALHHVAFFLSIQSRDTFGSSEPGWSGCFLFSGPSEGQVSLFRNWTDAGICRTSSIKLAQI
ncbi:hypothetical protein OJAV_G00203170 [Oryzias javanicus]|uniref:Uncharacterized protein n=1 Tax=Oryzias javanicus TaxID=123683 RepID=A0A3S2PQ47_ORYJA|nr:hypothetical protein OJAV_G00203170 [Oryzias javanicus]